MTPEFGGSELSRLAARRLLDLDAPTVLVEWATEAVAAGAEDQVLVELASVETPDADTVEQLVSRLLEKRGLSVPSTSEALDLLIRLEIGEIARGARGAIDGARAVVRLASTDDDWPTDSLPFVALLDEHQAGNLDTQEAEADIRQVARSIVDDSPA